MTDELPMIDEPGPMCGTAALQRWNIADADSTEDSWLVDTCVRTFVLVLVSLLGLLALGVMYGNVLGAVHASP